MPPVFFSRSLDVIAHVVYTLIMKATHKGSCQGCGSVQMLPDGVLAKHGYTVKWGFFSGICAGTGSRPFETHTDLIEKFIEGAEERKRENLEFIAVLLTRPTEAKGWVNRYRTAKTRYEHSGYYWHETQFEMRQGQYDSKPCAYFANPDKFGEWLNCYTNGMEIAWDADRSDILNYVQAANEKKAAAVAKENEEIDRYIAWQRRRIAEWKEQPLTPR